MRKGSQRLEWMPWHATGCFCWQLGCHCPPSTSSIMRLKASCGRCLHGQPALHQPSTPHNCCCFSQGVKRDPWINWGSHPSRSSSSPSQLLSTRNKGIEHNRLEVGLENIESKGKLTGNKAETHWEGGRRKHWLLGKPQLEGELPGLVVMALYDIWHIATEGHQEIIPFWWVEYVCSDPPNDL